MVRIVAFQAIGSGSIPGGLNLSGVAQWKRVGLITQRSKDRNLLLLNIRFHSVVVSTSDFESGNPSSNLGGTFLD